MSISATPTSVASPAAPPRALFMSLRAEYLVRWLPWIAGALTLAAAVHAIEPLPVGVFYDDAQYLVLAKALAMGQGYRFLNLPGAPAATHFPPGYPALLAVLWRVAPSFPENVALFKFVNAIFLAAVAVLAAHFAHRVLALPRALAAIAAVAGTATIPSLVLSSAIMSEPLFLALLLPLLLWSEESLRTIDEHSPRHALAIAALLGVAAAVLALVRSHGIAFAAALVVAFVIRRRWREAIACAIASIVTIAPWLLWVGAHDHALPMLLRGAYGSYTAWFAAGWREEGMQLLAVTVPDNVASIWMSIVRSIVPQLHPTVDMIAGGIYLLLTVAGVERCWRRARVTVFFIGIYFAIVVVWPFSPLRFVWAVWPLLMLLAAAGLRTLWESGIVRQRAPRRAALVGLASFFGLAVITFNLRGYANAWWSSNARYHARRVVPQLAWVERSTRPGDLVAADAEAAIYLYTGRHAVPVTTFTAAEYVHQRTVAEDQAILKRLLDEYHPRYVLVTSPQLVDATARLARQARRTLIPADTLGPGVVYEVRNCTPLANAGNTLLCE